MSVVVKTAVHYLQETVNNSNSLHPPSHYIFWKRGSIIENPFQYPTDYEMLSDTMAIHFLVKRWLTNRSLKSDIDILVYAGQSKKLTLQL